VAFFALGKLKKVSVEGGTLVVLCNADLPSGDSWGDDGNLIASLNTTQPLARIPASGGTPTPMTNFDSEHGELTQRWPKSLRSSSSVDKVSETS
jgi:hypothetical protein